MRKEKIKHFENISEEKQEGGGGNREKSETFGISPRI